MQRPRYMHVANSSRDVLGQRRRVEGDAAVDGELDHVRQQTNLAQRKQVVELAHVVRDPVRVAVEGAGP